MKEFLFKNKKLVIIASGIIIVALIIVGSVYAISFNNNPLKINKKEITIEYGDKISTDPKEYLAADVKTDIISQTKVNIEGVVEDGKEYYSVGDYKLTLKYENYDAIIDVKVQDTTIPELTVPLQVEIQKNTDISQYDFKSLLQAKDLSPLGEYNIDTTKIDTTNIGEYEVTVSIEDQWKNKNEKSFKVNIVDVEANENEEIKTEVVTQEDGTKKVVVKKETKTDNSNSSTQTSQNNENNNSSSSTNSGSTSKPSGGSSSSSSNKEEEKPHTHVFANKVDKWFNTQAECKNYFVQVSNSWETKADKGEITWDEYYKKCPVGYEVIVCTCGMRGIILSYR